MLQMLVEEYMLFVGGLEYLMVELQMYKELLMLLEKLKNTHSYLPRKIKTILMKLIRLD